VVVDNRVALNNDNGEKTQVEPGPTAIDVAREKEHDPTKKRNRGTTVQVALGTESAPAPKRRKEKDPKKSKKHTHEAVNLRQLKMKDLSRSSRKLGGAPMKAALDREEEMKKRRIERNLAKAQGIALPAPKPKSSSTSTFGAKAQAHPVQNDRQPTTIMAPQVQMIDGRIVINTDSLVIVPEQENNDHFDTVYEGNGRKITSSSYTNRRPAERWSNEETYRFYQALRQCGTDFTMITTLFPSRTRRQIKAKFKKEERERHALVDQALDHRLPLRMVA